MEQKYGPESASTSRSIPFEVTSIANDTNPSKARDEALKRRLRDFFLIYDPRKTDHDINQLISQYSRSPGGFEHMWVVLEREYGPEAAVSRRADLAINDAKSPTNQTDPYLTQREWLVGDLPRQKQRLINYYAFYVPEKTEEDIVRVLYRYTKTISGVNGMWDQLQRKYGPEPADHNSLITTRDRLKKFFAHYDPEKSEADIDTLLKKYPANSRNYDDMWSVLERRYGPEDFNNPLAKPRPIIVERPAFNFTTLLPPATVIDDDPGHQRRVQMEKIGTKSRQMGEAASLVGSTISIVAMTVTIHGAELSLYERAPHDRRAKFREAIELDISLNIGIQKKFVSVTRLTVGSGLLCDLNVELPTSRDPFDVLSTLQRKVKMGSCTCSNLRDSYRRDLAGNPVQLYYQELNDRSGLKRRAAGKADTVAVDASSPAPSFTPSTQATHSPVRPNLWVQSSKPQQVSPFLHALWETPTTSASVTSVAPYNTPQQSINPTNLYGGFGY